MPPSPTDPPEGIVAYRLTAIETRMDRFERAVYQRLDSVQGSIGALTFVRQDLFDQAMKGVQTQIAGAEKEAASAHGIAMWALGTVAVLITLLGALVVALKAAGA